MSTACVARGRVTVRVMGGLPSRMVVAKAAMDTGVARKPIEDMDAYRQSLRSRRAPIASGLQQVFQRLRQSPKRVVVAEG